MTKQIIHTIHSTIVIKTNITNLLCYLAFKTVIKNLGNKKEVKK